jgi:hypothetical protein
MLHKYWWLRMKPGGTGMSAVDLLHLHCKRVLSTDVLGISFLDFGSQCPQATHERIPKNRFSFDFCNINEIIHFLEISQPKFRKLSNAIFMDDLFNFPTIRMKMPKKWKRHRRHRGLLLCRAGREPVISTSSTKLMIVEQFRANSPFTELSIRSHSITPRTTQRSQSWEGQHRLIYPSDSPASVVMVERFSFSPRRSKPTIRLGAS